MHWKKKKRKKEEKKRRYNTRKKSTQSNIIERIKIIGKERQKEITKAETKAKFK